VHDARAPLVCWAEVPYLDSSIGDHKIVWDAESGAGIMPKANLQAGLWSVFRIPGGQQGNIVRSVFTTTSPAAKFVADNCWSARPILAPGDPDLLAFDRNQRALHERLGRLDLRDLCFDPVPLIDGPCQGRPPARTPRAGQLQDSNGLVEAKPESPRISHAANFDGDGE